ncbi:MAG: hypothetical protein RJB24_191 [Candidatus Parcubacteria bacterium]|jgi:hypothetical protein
MENKEHSNLRSHPVRKRTILTYVLISVSVLALRVYTPTMSAPNPGYILSLAKNGLYTFFSDKTFPEPDDPKARCSLIRQKPWYQRWGLCWK